MPLIIYDPRAAKKQRGKVADQMALNTDIATTILSYAGVKVSGHYQGRSLRAIMNGGKPNDWHKDTFCEHLMENAYIPKWEGVRGRRNVYARYFQQEPPYEYLHDLRQRCNDLRDEYGGEYDPSLVANYKKEQNRKRAESQGKRKAAQQKKQRQN